MGLDWDRESLIRMEALTAVAGFSGSIAHLADRVMILISCQW